MAFQEADLSTSLPPPAASLRSYCDVLIQNIGANFKENYVTRITKKRNIKRSSDDMKSSSKFFKCGLADRKAIYCKNFLICFR